MSKKHHRHYEHTTREREPSRFASRDPRLSLGALVEHERFLHELDESVAERQHSQGERQQARFQSDLRREQERRKNEQIYRQWRSRPSGSDRRLYHPDGDSAPAVDVVGRVAGMASASWASSAARVFVNPSSVIPCIQRAVRREVMFAFKKAGHGHHKKKRRNWMSEVPC